MHPCRQLWKHLVACGTKKAKLKTLNLWFPIDLMRLFIKRLWTPSTNGAFDVTTMGSVSNVGLWRRRLVWFPWQDFWIVREEGRSDRERYWMDNGKERTTNLFSHKVNKGISSGCVPWKMSLLWLGKLAVSRARAVGTGIFWLDSNQHTMRWLPKWNDIWKVWYRKGRTVYSVTKRCHASYWTTGWFGHGIYYW